MRSQNGWPINPTARSPLIVAGVPFGDVLDGPVHVVLGYVALRYHVEVEPLRAGQCGAYNPRKIARSAVWSNHASATAIDINWLLHQLGVAHTHTPEQEAAIGEIIDDCDGVVRWGGSFTGPRVDPMHFEIIGGPAEALRLAVKLTQTEDDMKQADFVAYMNAWADASLSDRLSAWADTPDGQQKIGAAVLSRRLGKSTVTVAAALQNTEISVRDLPARLTAIEGR